MLFGCDMQSVVMVGCHGAHVGAMLQQQNCNVDVAQP
jgi:hypothetical protein